MNNRKFKVGDIVECINDTIDALTINDHYIVTSDEFYRLEDGGKTGYITILETGDRLWWSSRFELVSRKIEGQLSVSEAEMFKNCLQI